ncbi:hypothetical protein ACVWZW_004469 [Bradyrhizobium sp. F1.13.4]
MTIGRSNSEASETRNSVSWKVERVPNSGRNCLGRTSREAGHSRVPAPPHMIRGIMRFPEQTGAHEDKSATNNSPQLDCTAQMTSKYYSNYSNNVNPSQR